MSSPEGRIKTGAFIARNLAEIVSSALLIPSREMRPGVI